MARVVLFKTPGIYPHLQAATVEMADEATDMFALSTPVDTPDGPTSLVPVASCIEFDGELMDKVNTLVNRASDALDAALKIINAEARPVEFQRPDNTPGTIYH